MDHLLHLLLFLGRCYVHNEILASNFTDLETCSRFAVDATLAGGEYGEAV